MARAAAGRRGCRSVARATNRPPGDCARKNCALGSSPLEVLPMSDLFSLQGRVALVTGGSRGIGKMIAA
eukprot:gene284-381_t